jgi:predicted PurR-regulated permease PerM
MALVGVLVALTMWLIGLPSPLALGLIAGLTEFIPFVGPILGALPAILIAVTRDTSGSLALGCAILGSLRWRGAPCHGVRKIRCAP